MAIHGKIDIALDINKMMKQMDDAFVGLSKAAKQSSFSMSDFNDALTAINNSNEAQSQPVSKCIHDWEHHYLNDAMGANKLSFCRRCGIVRKITDREGYKLIEAADSASQAPDDSNIVQPTVRKIKLPEEGQ